MFLRFWHVFFLLLLAKPLFSLDVQEVLDERVKNGGSTGMVLALVTGNEIKIYSSGQLSLSNPKKVDEDTIFEIGSITKVFTTIMLQKKILQGEMALLDPVEKYLKIRLPQKDGVFINFLHLATHTSGLPYSPTNHSMQSISNPFGSYTRKEFDQFFESYVLPRVPGALYEYSNVGSGLLGNLLADLEGVDYEELVQKEMCAPLGMKRTHIHLTDEMLENLAKGHLGKKEVNNWDLPAFPGAGGLRSCVKDLVLFLQANMGILNTTLYNAMRESHQRICKSDDPDVDVALGWHIMHRFFPEIIWHNGGTGGYRSFLGFCPSLQRGVIILSNSSTKIEDIGFHLLDERYPLEKVGKEILLDPIVLKEYEGRYRHRLGLSCNVYQDNRGKLFVQVKGFPDARALPISERRFFFKEAPAQISFESNSSGEKIMVVFYGDQRYVFRKIS